MAGRLTEIAKSPPKDQVPRMRIKDALVLLALVVPGAPQAHAAASEWHHLDGASIRLVTAGTPGVDGELLGALEIRLKPGWKTYWQDPGDSGVPPSVRIIQGENETAPEIGFPAPRRFDDGYANWAGYDRSLALALTVREQPSTKSGPLTADVFIGVCETICVPVQATLTLDPAAEANNADHATIVAAAFAALPGPARPGFGLDLADSADEHAINLDAEVPRGVQIVDLFVSGSEGMMLGAPVRRAEGGRTTFRVPATSTGGKTLSYTLVTSAGSVHGTIQLP